MSKCIKLISPSQKRLVASLLVGAFIFLARPINALAQTPFVYTFNDAINLTLGGSFGATYSTFIPVTPNLLNANAFVSMSGGGLTGAEGYATLFARFSEQPDVELGSWAPFEPANFASDLTLLTFSAPAPATFTGLVIQWRPVPQSRELSIPVGTTLTMSVPEPTTAAFLAAGAVVIVSLSRRRRD
jgi:hypothetical protein